MWFNNKKIPISEVSEFTILPYTENRKLGNLGKFSSTSIFGSIWNSKSKNGENDLKEKTWNRKLGNLGKFLFTSNSYHFSCIKYGKG